jgi:hypothetical protein
MGKGVAFTQARRKDTKAVAAATAVQGGGAAIKLCHGHPGHAGARAGRPWHGFGCGYAPRCAMAILAMPEHGRDARGTALVAATPRCVSVVNLFLLGRASEISCQEKQESTALQRRVRIFRGATLLPI